MTHMKTTIDIADSLLLRAKARAKEQRITLRAVIEEALALSLNRSVPEARIRPVTVTGKGLSREFEGASWEKIREAIY